LCARQQRDRDREIHPGADLRYVITADCPRGSRRTPPWCQPSAWVAFTSSKALDDEEQA
jgi:hypothetical protein